MQIPIAAATPSAVRSSGRIHLGRRRAIALSTRFSGLASRKLGSRTAVTADMRSPRVVDRGSANRTTVLTIGQQSWSSGFPHACRQVDTRAMTSTYHDGSRRLQDRFDTRRLADLIDDRF